MTRRHIPVTILGGYLGAGKTTVINHLLAGNHGVRIAVLVNDFGAVNVDASLIAEQSDETISLANGCVCCSIADDLGAALDSQTARTEPPDHIVIEASGVAEPARIASYAQGWPGVALNNVVTVVDAETGRGRAEDKFVGGVVQRQIKAADLLILNKCDLQPAAQVAVGEQWMDALNNTAYLVRTSRGEISADMLLRSANVDAIATIGEGHFHQPMISRYWEPSTVIDAVAVAETLRRAPASIHRTKGFVTDRTTGKRLLVQAVGRRVGISPAGGFTEPDGLVLIGIDATVLDELIEKLDRLGDNATTKNGPA